MKHELWRQVEDALDARLDPFALPGLRDALAKDPDAERSLRKLMGLLSSLQEPAALQAMPSSTSRRAKWKPLAVAAGILLLITFGSGLLPLDSEPHPLPTPLRSVESVSLRIEHSSPPPARGSRVVLESRSLMTWTLEGESR